MFFYLKEPNNDKETIIIIQYYIADEKKIFKYSTGEVIYTLPIGIFPLVLQKIKKDKMVQDFGKSLLI